MPNQITNSDFSDKKAVQRLADVWKETPACQALNARIEAPLSPALTEGSKASWFSAALQLRELVARASMNSVRDPAAYALRYVLRADEDVVW